MTSSKRRNCQDLKNASESSVVAEKFVAIFALSYVLNESIDFPCYN